MHIFSFHTLCTTTELHFQHEMFTLQQKEINIPQWACVHTNNFKAGYQKSLKIASAIRTTGSISKDPSLHAAIQYTWLEKFYLSSDITIS